MSEFNISKHLLNRGTQHSFDVETYQENNNIVLMSINNKYNRSGGWMIFYFSIVKVHFIFCYLYFIIFFSYLINDDHSMFIIIVLFLFRVILSSYLLLYFLCLISFLLFQCMSSTFHRAIQNGTRVFRQCNYNCSMCIRTKN